jgi:DNA-3-methyladenine glycosylase I
MPGVSRCAWCGSDPLYVAYHDEEWGVPVHDDRALYEKLILDGFQAGLSWILILRRRDGLLEAFDGLDPEKVARFTPRRIEQLLQDKRIIRNRQKVHAAVRNAQAWLKIMEGPRSFSELLWSHVEHSPIVNNWTSDECVPCETSQSTSMARELKSLGFGFCGPTICYAFMQATGMVNDHVVSCFRHREVAGRS